MSFTGDLEHLPIVDVIQLLHATRKSGILRVKSRKGESQLVFKDGCIVGANHLNNSIRIGTILIEFGVITQEALDQVLEEQEKAGQWRRPLIVMLIEKGLVQEADAYKCLEHLIEMTIVDILTWRRGTFTLDVMSMAAPDDYRYYPGKMNLEINVDAQSALMDALRIYDEKVRDGELVEEEEVSEEEPIEAAAVPEGAASLLSADDLGLANLDRLERKIPAVFTSLDDPDATGDAGTAAGLTPEEGEELLGFLQKPVRFWSDRPMPAGTVPSIILFSADEILTYCITSVCRQEGIHVFSSTDEDDLEHIVTHFQTKQDAPLLVLDRPGKPQGLSSESLSALRQQLRQHHPEVSLIQLAPPQDFAFAVQAYKEGVKAVIPAPSLEVRRATFVSDAQRFLEAFLELLCGYASSPGHDLSDSLRSAIAALRELSEPPQVALALLQFVAAPCERALTLIVKDGELIAEKSIGIKGEKSRGASPPLGIRLPVAAPSLLQTVIEEGQPFFGPTDDATLTERLFPAIGAPQHPLVLLLPLQRFGKTIAVTYGDFGRGEEGEVPLELLEILARHAGLVLENVAYRKKREAAAS